MNTTLSYRFQGPVKTATKTIPSPARNRADISRQIRHQYVRSDILVYHRTKLTPTHLQVYAAKVHRHRKRLYLEPPVHGSTIVRRKVTTIVPASEQQAAVIEKPAKPAHSPPVHVLEPAPPPSPPMFRPEPHQPVAYVPTHPATPHHAPPVYAPMPTHLHPSSVYIPAPEPHFQHNQEHHNCKHHNLERHSYEHTRREAEVDVNHTHTHTNTPPPPTAPVLNDDEHADIIDVIAVDVEEKKKKKKKKKRSKSRHAERSRSRSREREVVIEREVRVPIPVPVRVPVPVPVPVKEELETYRYVEGIKQPKRHPESLPPRRKRSPPPPRLPYPWEQDRNTHSTRSKSTVRHRSPSTMGSTAGRSSTTSLEREMDRINITIEERRDARFDRGRDRSWERGSYYR